MDEFGVSGAANTLFSHFGFTVENVVAKAMLSLKNVKADEKVEAPVEAPVETEETETVEA